MAMKKTNLILALTAAASLFACGAPSDPPPPAGHDTTQIARSADAFDAHGAVKTEYTGACTPSEILACQRLPDGVGCIVQNNGWHCIFQ
jgi:hypothetical protein